MNKKKILSLIMALVMLVGVFSPLTAFADNANHPVTVPTGKVEQAQLKDTKPTETTVNLYKLTTKDEYKPGAPWKHTGGKITDTEALGTNVKPLKGAQFTFYKINGKDDVENEKILELLKKNSDSFKTTEDMTDLINNGKTGLKASEADKNLTEIAKSKLAVAKTTSDTDESGLASVDLADGYYWVIESKIPAGVTSQIAVPFGLTLPLTNAYDVTDASGQNVIAKAGTKYLNPVYIYPKNLQTDKVRIDKDHATYDAKTKTWKDQNGNVVQPSELGADYDKYTQDKKTLSAQLGESIPYDSKTEIPRNYTFTEFSWQDVMSEGLTYDKDSLKVTMSYTKLNAQGQKEEVKDEVFIDTTSDPKVNANLVTRQDGSGFDIHVKKTDVENTLVEYLKQGKVEFKFAYTAKVNKNTVVDKPETNSITFTPGKPNGGGKVTSKDKSISITKTWDTDKNPTVSEVTYYVVGPDGNTVASVTLTNSSTGEIVAGPGIKFVVGDNWYSGKFTGLEEGKEYTVREAVVGYDPTYTTSDQAGILVINNKTNPNTLKPKEPKVEFHGKKFVKYDQLDETKRLAGAEFVVKNGEGTDAKYLVAKTSTQANAENVNLTEKKNNLDTAIKAYNDLSAEDQKGTKGDTAKTNIDKAQAEYNKAFKDAANAYTWEPKSEGKLPEGVVTLVSDAQGRFEITGLSAGEYYLEETKAPDGYALIDKAIKFEVKHGTYAGDKATELKYTPTDTDEGTALAKDGYGMKIANKKMTIPQTGGMGTVLFTVVGIGLMAGAVMAMKKNREEA